MSVLKKYDNQVASGRIVPNEDQIQKQSDLTQTFTKTNYDLENPAPFGGPNQQKYTPTDTFSNSAEGTIRGVGKLQTGDVFKKTSLDLENPQPVGGPNRTNAANIPAGTYQVNTQQGPLLYKQDNLAGKESKTIVNKNLNQFTPTNTYLDYIKPYKSE